MQWNWNQGVIHSGWGKWAVIICGGCMMLRNVYRYLNNSSFKWEVGCPGLWINVFHGL